MSKVAELRSTRGPARSPEPPDDLGEVEKAAWRAIALEFAITDAGGLALLTDYARSLHLARRCAEQIELDGLQPKPGKAHPLLKVMHDARSSARAALKALNLDLEPLRDGVGRPASGR